VNVVILVRTGENFIDQFFCTLILIPRGEKTCEARFCSLLGLSTPVKISKDFLRPLGRSLVIISLGQVPIDTGAELTLRASSSSATASEYRPAISAVLPRTRSASSLFTG
jgi:hypothetical protein